MLRKLKEKKGNEILQTLVIVAIIGALAITVCVLIATKLRKTSADNMKGVGDGIQSSVKEFSYNSTNSGTLINGTL